MNFRADNIADVKTEFLKEPEVSPLEKIFCRHCLSGIADKRDIIEIEGSFFHYKKNPAGIFFTVLCFSKADGVNVTGEYTHEFSWFKGYTWCIALCSVCGSHLGWHYSGNGFFFGLISHRISGY